MGSLEYGNKTIEFDDRVLAHIQIVIVRKLRRGESFLLSWENVAETGPGRSSIWVHPAIPLYFKFHGSRSPSVNPVWLAELTLSADSSFGMLITSEKNRSEIRGKRTHKSVDMRYVSAAMASAIHQQRTREQQPARE